MYLWENDAEGWLDSATRAPVSRQQLWEYVTTYQAEPFSSGSARFVIVSRQTGEAIGAVDLTSIDALNRRAEVSIVIDKEYRRRGYARAALQLLADYCRLLLGLHQLYALTRAENLPSRQLFAAAGYRIGGRLRSWVRRGDSYSDAFVWQLLLV